MAPGTHPWALTEPLECSLSELSEGRERHISRWAIRLTTVDTQCVLFGCTEDVRCSHQHEHDTLLEYDTKPYIRILCEHCLVPICTCCQLGLRRHESGHRYRDGGTIPMALANDHYYGHINTYLVQHNVTWLECAASCMVWSTMLVYYLEEPYGPLMKEILGRPQGRTKVKGNLFSFSMPWEDIERCCHEAVMQAQPPHKEALKEIQRDLGLPHSEETLALLVNVHIVGGNKDLALHLKGLTMRVAVIQNLIDMLRQSGYPGYDNHGVNESSKVASRLHERYTSKYGTAQFTPAAVMEAVQQKDTSRTSIVQDKVATPADAPQAVVEWDKTLRPHHLVAERRSRCQSNIHEHYKAVFSQYGSLGISTGIKMENQHAPYYLGMTFPFTLPSVGMKFPIY